MKKLIGLLLCSSQAMAAPNDHLDLATTFGSLLFVIALILFLAWVLKRMRVPTFGNQKGLSIVRQLPVGTKERIVIVQAGEEQFLVGVTSQSVQLIAKLDAPLKQEEAEVSPFAGQLTQLLKKNDKK
ncbi:flagellar biosynthetic protein FliO [Vibrio anguillarum]|uniref:Flagellar protein n=2 Tax=Vibrio TaxID=662 RepID=A0A191W5C6_VIBAN|nr:MULTISPECIES: flagellar biosynthetic protein FliO [Vibrio]OXX66078.1 flagellar biosynthetic protein FliO [Vibrio sp. V03_P4A6T147]AEH32628.1 FliO [Vibrio anguillarum 775]AGU57190.1 flagellar biosynthesis protein FliO [Vibrio anguillarum M3]AQM19096.1 flagellar biosynthetic protein FliO [Vibrio anguillarum]AQP35644.1 flagellar biosynthetic protein FliO [Vibrio anguillarum]